MKKIAAIGMISTLCGVILMVIFEATMTSEMYESLSALVGLLLYVFGIWSSVLLLKK